MRREGRIKIAKLTNKNKPKLLYLLTPNITRWIEPISYPPTKKDKLNWIEKMNKEKSFVIINNSNKILGMTWLENIDKTNNTGEIGFFLGQNYQGKGFMSEALKLILNYGFNKLKLKKIIALTINFNKNSQKMLRSNGFILKKIIKKDYKEKFSGKWCDVLVYKLRISKRMTG